MMRGFAPLVAALVIAGCLAGSPVQAPTIPAGVDPALFARFGAPTLVGTGADTETSLAVGPDGTILACSHGGFTGPSPLWTSTDGGKSFTQRVTGETLRSGDCDVAATNGSWFELYTVVNQEAPGQDTCVGLVVTGACDFGMRLATSHDHGATWTITSPIPGAHVEDREWLAVAGATLDMVYVARPSGFGCGGFPSTCNNADALVFASSSDGGATWSTPVVAYTGNGPGAFVDGQPILSADGKDIAIPLSSIDSTDGVTTSESLVRSTDGGATWSASLVDRAPSHVPTFPSVARARDGSLRYAFAKGATSRATVLVAASTDDGATWGKPAIAADHAVFDPNATTLGDVIASPALALAPDGSATLAWMEAVASGNATATWTLHVARVTSALAVEDEGVAVPATHGIRSIAFEFLSARTAPDGRALVVYSWDAPGCPRAGAHGRNQQCIEMLQEN
ncbi:MAG: sialidase family protein [Thermoplasmatota archaeon]